MRKDIFDIFDHARELKIKNLGVLTNGIAVKGMLDRLKPYLIDSTLSLVFSLDSLKRDLHNLIRNSDIAWDRTIQALEAVSEMKKAHGRVSFNVISIILDQNLEELIQLAGFIRSLGADSLQFQALLANNLKMAERKQSMFWVREERLPLLDKALDGLVALKKKDPGFIKNSSSNLSLIKKYYRGELCDADVKCLSAYETVLISNQGTFTTCFHTYGDIRTQDLKEVLSGRKIIQARQAVGDCSWPCLLPCFCDA